MNKKNRIEHKAKQLIFFQFVGRKADCTSQFGGSVQFLRSGTSFDTICHDLDEAGLKSYAKNLKIPKSVTNVRFKLCSVPRTSYSGLIHEMGMTKVRSLYIMNR